MFVREGVQTGGFGEAFPKPSGPLPGFGGILCSAYRAVSKPTYFLLYQSSSLCSTTTRRTLAGPVLNELRSLPAQPSYCCNLVWGMGEKGCCYFKYNALRGCWKKACML